MASQPAWVWLVVVLWLVLAAGTLLALVSIFADQIGLGASPGFGWKQSVGVVIGLVLALVALWRLRGTRQRR